MPVRRMFPRVRQLVFRWVPSPCEPVVAARVLVRISGSSRPRNAHRKRPEGHCPAFLETRPGPPRRPVHATVPYVMTCARKCAGSARASEGGLNQTTRSATASNSGVSGNRFIRSLHFRRDASRKAPGPAVWSRQQFRPPYRVREKMEINRRPMPKPQRQSRASVKRKSVRCSSQLRPKGPLRGGQSDQIGDEGHRRIDSAFSPAKPAGCARSRIIFPAAAGRKLPAWIAGAYGPPV